MDHQILHIDLDAFFVSVEQLANPELRDKPVVVGGRSFKRGVVASASYEARAFGISSGMSLVIASRICPQAIFIAGNFPRYRDFSAVFMKILADFSPYIQPVGMDEAYLDITGSESLYGSPAQLALDLKKGVKDMLGLTASVGIASCKVVAKVASDLSKPDGLLIVGPGEERSFLSPLPVGRLPGVGKKTEREMIEIGITTIGKLAALPLERVRGLLGTAGVFIHQRANGIDKSKVELPGAICSISRETTFIEDMLNRRFLESTLDHLCERVGAELRREDKLARCITLKVRYADFKTITRSKTMKESTDADQVILAIGFQLLEKALSQRQQRVRLLGIKLSNLKCGGQQLNMLDRSAESLKQLNKTIDGIRLKYGFNSIQTGRTLSLRELPITENEERITPSKPRTY